MDAIFLDIDGTLWDSTHIVADAWNEVLEKKPEINLVITPDPPLSKLRSLYFLE